MKPQTITTFTLGLGLGCIAGWMNGVALLIALVTISSVSILFAMSLLDTYTIVEKKRVKK